MSDSFLFEAIPLSREPGPETLVERSIVSIAKLAGWELHPGSPGAERGSIWVRSGDVLAGISVSDEEPGEWALSVLDSDLRWADGEPDRPVQAAVSNLLRGLLVAATPYVGVSCWPFGPSLPVVYDTSAPFALAEVGSVMFLSDIFLAAQLRAADLTAAPVLRLERLAGGVLLWAADDLLRSAENGDLDDLRAYFGLPPAVETIGS